ncbi:MAG: 4Fe-4S dicluster domain-containing protein [Ardenticatenaceae bacterium]|nr:4Fe-4S dicluster domain-containing protein [Ardenticatenaceae bacterium]HBY96743.1 hypothetical protein [Chloroflexota bacterium]
MAQLAMLIDVTRCMGCRACQVACKEWNELRAKTTRNWGSYENPPDLSPNTWTRIRFMESGEKGTVPWQFFKEQCLHCTDAPCVKVCPTAALKNNPLGFVSFERDLCNGCGYCAEFCPFGVPRMEIINTLTGEAKASKCHLCQDRVTNGYEPACIWACPAEALSFGDRETMIAKGQERVARLQAGASRKFPDANLYGVDVLGGLGAMYVLPEKPDKYRPAKPNTFGLPANPESAFTLATAWQSILQPLGELVIGAGIVGVAINWIMTRRQVNQQEAQHGD